MIKAVAYGLATILLAPVSVRAVDLDLIATSNQVVDYSNYPSSIAYFDAGDLHNIAVDGESSAARLFFDLSTIPDFATITAASFDFTAGTNVSIEGGQVVRGEASVRLAIGDNIFDVYQAASSGSRSLDDLGPMGEFSIPLSVDDVQAAVASSNNQLSLLLVNNKTIDFGIHTLYTTTIGFPPFIPVNPDGAPTLRLSYIPEPTTATIFCLSLLTLMSRRHRRMS